MHRTFIDFDLLRATIRRQVAATPEILAPHRNALTRVLERLLPGLPIGRRVLPGAGDPDWARARAARGERVYRLGSQGLHRVRTETATLLVDVELLAELAADEDHGHGPEARRRLRGLAHWQVTEDPDLWQYTQLSLSARLGLAGFLRQAEAAPDPGDRLPYGVPAVIEVGALVGHRASCMADLLRIGAEARNCLASRQTARAMIESDSDVWALRAGGRLVAVVEVRAGGHVGQVRGPNNRSRFAGHLGDIVLFCARLGLRVSVDVEVSLADFLPEHLRLEDEDEARRAA